MVALFHYKAILHLPGSIGAHRFLDRGVLWSLGDTAALINLLLCFPCRKKTPEGRTSSSKLQAARTKSDGSDTEPFREEGRPRRSTPSSRDLDNRSAHDDSDVVCI